MSRAAPTTQFACSAIRIACEGDRAEPAAIAVELELSPAGVISSPLISPSVRTNGCRFSEGAPPVPPASVGQHHYAGPPRNREGERRTGSTGRHESDNFSARLSPTRIRPPRDLVKLSDRLRMILEPPLESLLSLQQLRFAFPPFAYQLDGVAFLYPRHEAVLADEMGLGKTMQTVTAVRLLAHQGQLRRVLLVCPKPLVSNWQREFSLWAPELPLTIVEGGPVRRQWLWRQGTSLITVANYESLVRDREHACDPANRYDLVVLDEAQRIKNCTSATSEAVRALARSRSWALTGTPIENCLSDLFGIFEFVSPGQLQPTMKPRAAGRAIADHVLRRTKEQVLSDLPPKLFRDAEVELTPEQAESYRLAEDEGIIRLRAMKHELTIQHVFELVLRLKQICNFDPTTGASSKLERLEADLDECAASGRKAIVFSQWVGTLELLRERLARFGPDEYHGKIPHRRREAVIERFRRDDDCCVLLMSYGAGSVGLNLQFASYVFLFDRWWNPAVEDQAINRAHRIGVERPVTVTRFLAVNTIEQRINQVLERKRELFDAVFDATHSSSGGGLSREEVFALFDLGGQSAAA